MIALTDDQQDALREVANLAMGEAGVNLSKVLNSYIQLSIPEIHILEFSQLAIFLTELNANFGQTISIVRLGFQGFFEGEALLVYGPNALESIHKLLDDALNEEAREGMLLREISNILAAACLNGITRRLYSNILITPPSIYSHKMPSKDSFDVMFAKNSLNWHETLLIKISFKFENKDFQCNLIIFFSENCIEKLQERLEQILNEM